MWSASGMPLGSPGYRPDGLRLMGQVAGARRVRANDHPTMNSPTITTPSDHRVRHVLLAADLDGSSTHAAEDAIALAAAQDAILLILTVVPPDPLLRRRSARAERERRKRGLREIVARANARGVVATSVVWYGEPADAILEAARTQRPDVVVLGSRKRSGVKRLFGSVSSQVAESAPCPVVIVPA